MNPGEEVRALWHGTKYGNSSSNAGGIAHVYESSVLEGVGFLNAWAVGQKAGNAGGTLECLISSYSRSAKTSTGSICQGGVQLDTERNLRHEAAAAKGLRDLYDTTGRHFSEGVPPLIRRTHRRRIPSPLASSILHDCSTIWMVRPSAEAGSSFSFGGGLPGQPKNRTLNIP